MIIVTGGAGFIGSNIVKALNEMGRKDILVVDNLKDGTKFIEYRSISFGRMTQKTFEAYVREQLPFIYGEVIQVLYPDKETSDRIIAAIEDEFKKFLAKL